MFRTRSVALACATFAVALTTQAQSSAPIDFAVAARKTLSAQPHLRRLPIDLEVARSREAAAALQAPLEVGAEFENVAGTGAAKGIDAAEITLSVSSLFERGDKRDARMEEARRFVELLSVEQRVELLDALSETGRRFVAVAVAQELRDLAGRRAEQAKQTLDLIATRVGAGRSPRTEQLNAEIELSAAEVVLAQADRELEASQLSLASQWAKPEERPVVAADLTVLAEPRAFNLLSQQLSKLPDLDRFAAEGRLRDAELRLAQSQAVADWRWSAGVRRLEQSDDQALVLGFSVPIGTARRNAAAIRAVELQRNATGLDGEARRLELLGLLHTNWQQMQSSRLAAATIFDKQLPRAREALELTQRGYEIGRFPYRELALARQQVLSLEVLRLQASARYHLTRIEIERLTGAQLALLEGTLP